MGPIEVLIELNRRGVELIAAGDRLRFRPREAVSEDLRSLIVEHKSDLLRVLGSEVAEVAWRVEAMRPQVPRTGTIPILLARPEAKTAPRGTCLSCGDALAPGRMSRCAPCVAAVERVLNEIREQADAAETRG